MEPGTRRRLTREEARQQTRERLLDAAADVFKRLGYHGASLEAVAEAAGYTKGAVYSNFDTKADLFQALLDRYVQAEIASQEQLFAGMTLQQAIDSLEAIFDTFYRVRTRETAAVKGSGLGLAICRGIVRAHGGKIWANLPKSGGFDVSFTLPQVASESLRATA